jgi:hypothetical protein
MLYGQMNINAVAFLEGQQSPVGIALQLHAVLADIYDAAAFWNSLFANEKGVDIDLRSRLTSTFHGFA